MKTLSLYFVAALYLSTLPSIAKTPSINYERITIADRLLRPWDMAFIDENSALITEKEGGLQLVNLHNGQKIEIQGLPTDVDNRNRSSIGDNSGLFAVKLDPDFSQNRWIYLSYAARDPNGLGTTTKVIRARLNQHRLQSIEPLFTALPYSKDRYHYGGGMVFGSDDKLYFTVGERLFTEADQPAMPIAQDYLERRGKIYRINRDGSIPKDNPKISKNAVPGIYAVGIRAAQGLTVNPMTDEIWFSEHGTHQGDEINRLISGANYGWPIHTSGKYRHAQYQPPPLKDRNFTSPAWSWKQTVAPTGLTFYTGSEFPEWHGDLFVAGLSRGSLWRIRTADGDIANMEQLFINAPIRLRNVKQSPKGAIYLLTDEANGRLMKLQPTTEDNH